MNKDIESSKNAENVFLKNVKKVLSIPSIDNSVIKQFLDKIQGFDEVSADLKICECVNCKSAIWIFRSNSDKTNGQLSCDCSLLKKETVLAFYNTSKEFNFNIYTKYYISQSTISLERNESTICFIARDLSEFSNLNIISCSAKTL